MNVNGLHLLFVLLVICLNVVSGHQCPKFEPMSNFDMEQFLGTWYAIQTTTTPLRCLVYDITGLANRSDDVHETTNNDHSFGELKVDPSLPSKMFISFPPSLPFYTFGWVE
ncbi:uncharacterized protein LOC126843307 [Adelges cooleyi]|uniref:uncharacterized protein LOC126843307 n=1 Tax=Adelges cooleyi TaxID=133065 RepID=UPI00217FFDDC|nr:uncharacterized protein LOC126843307 [Adelges cooleyi]